MNKLSLYLSRQASSRGRYVREQTILTLFGWIPTVIGVGIRALAYRLILHVDGLVAIEKGVRIRYADHVRLARGVYLDEATYLHACPNGISLGENTMVMHGSILHVYNFRNLPNAHIRIGRESLIGELNVLRGQGGIWIGDRVYTAPNVQLLAVNHVYGDPTRPIIEQGITAEGIVIEDDVWIGAGAIVTDGVRVGCGSVIAAGAVVTTDIPHHSVAGGIPARVLKHIDAATAAPARRVYL